MTEREPEGGFPFLPQVAGGETADVYFLRSRDTLRHAGLDPSVGMEIFPSRPGVFCGGTQVAQLLQEAGFEGQLWTLSEGDRMERKEAAIQITASYSSFGVYETAMLGILASCSGWATAAREVADAARPVPVTSFGARHVHPNVAGVMDYSAVVGGCAGCSTPLGARLAGSEAAGTMPHALILIVGDTVLAAKLFDRAMPPDVPRIVLVDTFQDEAVESLRVAESLGPALRGVRLDTPGERGGVTPALVAEVRARLDLAGFDHVQIVVSGGVTPERLTAFAAAGAPVDGYGVGSYISSAAPIDFTGDIREIDGRPVAKRGRIPGMQSPTRLRRLL